MAGTTVTDPLLRKRKTRKPIGHMETRYWCLDCWSRIDGIALPYIERESEPLVEGDDAGVPYDCHKCGEPLIPDEATQVPA